MTRTVSVITPALRHDALLDAMLATVATQNLPTDVRLDVVVALGEESARPIKIDGLDVRVVANPTKSIPAGLNKAIAASTGEFVVRVDARCDLPVDYVATVLEWLAKAEVGCVGGAQLVTDPGFGGETYAVAFNSPLLGPSAYRYSRTTGPTESPYLGAWRREVLVELGGFDERLLRNQDNELASRVHASGRGAIFDASLVVGYRADRTWRGLARHHQEFGRWRARQSRAGQQGVSGRQVGALAVVSIAAIVFAALLVLPVTRIPALAVAAAGYLALSWFGWFCASRLRRERPDLRLGRLPILAALAAPLLAIRLNLAWLMGYLRGRQDNLLAAP